MGGAVIFTYACLGPSELAGQITGWLGESPDFGLPADAPTRQPAFVLMTLRLAGRILPQLTLTVKLDETFLSRDKAMQMTYVDDPLAKHLWTLEGIFVHVDRTTSLPMVLIASRPRSRVCGLVMEPMINVHPLTRPRSGWNP
jgi:alpha-beta hydrolase superfamily lysophospholipase